MSRKSRAKPPSPFRCFNSSPEVIRLAANREQNRPARFAALCFDPIANPSELRCRFSSTIGLCAVYRFQQERAVM